jgi:hypothetical protein
LGVGDGDGFGPVGESGTARVGWGASLVEEDGGQLVVRGLGGVRYGPETSWWNEN